jgi:DNA (cytosine-5)-methyltransferase 1
MQMKPVYNHQTRKVGEVVQSRINALGIGQKMQDLPEELWHDSFRFYVKEDPTRRGGPNLRMIRLDPEQPSLTVTGYIYNKFVHPYENRFITPREAARLQGFPDEMEFKGSLGSVQQQVGDAVPIELGQALFRSLLEFAKSLAPTLQSFPAISLFSGAGGLDIAADSIKALDGSQWKTVASVEIEKDRCNTLSSHFGEQHPVINANISDLETKYLLEKSNTSTQDIWLVYGGPPCQSFSQAGKQKGIIDPRGDLIFQFLRVVREISPPLFLMENVSNLRAISQGALLKSILMEMDILGYNVQCQILNAADYGTAQKRRRLIFFGTKKTISNSALLPIPTHSEKTNLFGLPTFKTVGEALVGLHSLEETYQVNML